MNNPIECDRIQKGDEAPRGASGDQFDLSRIDLGSALKRLVAAWYVEADRLTVEGDHSPYSKPIPRQERGIKALTKCAMQPNSEARYEALCEHIATMGGKVAVAHLEELIKHAETYTDPHEQFSKALIPATHLARLTGSPNGSKVVIPLYRDERNALREKLYAMESDPRIPAPIREAAKSAIEHAEVRAVEQFAGQTARGIKELFKQSKPSQRGSGQFAA